jgi:hypothetical protein
MQKLKYLGVPIFMDGKNWYFPSLSTLDFRNNYDGLVKVFPADTPFTEIYNHYAPIILLAVQRNYPELTAEQLESMFDLYTFKLAIKAIQAASGIEPVSEGE